MPPEHSDGIGIRTSCLLTFTKTNVNDSGTPSTSLPGSSRSLSSGFFCDFASCDNITSGGINAAMLRASIQTPILFRSIIAFSSHPTVPRNSTDSERITMSVSEKLLPEFDREFATTRKFLALVPDDKLGWKPHTKSMELGRLAWHLSDFPGYALSITSQPGIIAKLEDLPKRRSAWVDKNRAAILERFDTDLTAAHEALKGLPDAAWDDPWKME